jgi:protein-S-isoprenylcysteine O-methyltransferase Ste14
MAFGAALILWAAYTLLRHSGSTGAPGDPTRRLVTAGPYRWTRNPIYLGDGLLILGMAFFGRSPSLLLLDLVYLAGIDGYVRRVEEPAVERRFGRAYLAYRKDVPRWIPWRGQNNSAV